MTCTQAQTLMITPPRDTEEAARRWFWGCVGLSVTLHLLVVIAATEWTMFSPHLEKPDEPGIAVEFRINALPSSAAEPPSTQELQSAAMEQERPIEKRLLTEAQPEKQTVRSKHAETAKRAGNPNTTTKSEATPSPQGNPHPEYPDFARRKGWQGECLLRVVVSPEGKADAVSVHRSSGYALLDQSAVAAVRRWKFLPRIVGGQRLASTIEVPVNFSLLNR